MVAEPVKNSQCSKNPVRYCLHKSAIFPAPLSLNTFLLQNSCVLGLPSRSKKESYVKTKSRPVGSVRLWPNVNDFVKFFMKELSSKPAVKFGAV